jgi:hypothetical protein
MKSVLKIIKTGSALVACFILTGFASDNCGCLNPITVQYEVITSSSGGGINISWSAPPTGGSGCWGNKEAEPDSYVVVVDGVDCFYTQETQYELNTPGAEIIIYAVYGTAWSTGITVGDFEAIETNINVWTTDDPDPNHPSGFGFNPNGTAQTYAVSDPSRANDIDYYIHSGYVLTAPADHLPTPINEKGSAASMEDGSYDDLKIVKAPGNYLTQQNLSVNGLYGLWLDDANDGYDDGDYFGKAFVTGILGEQIFLDVAYQTEAGLRWVCTE